MPDFSLRLLGLTSDRAVTQGGSGEDGNVRSPREEDEVLLQLQVCVFISCGLNNGWTGGGITMVGPEAV